MRPDRCLPPRPSRRRGRRRPAALASAAAAFLPLLAIPAAAQVTLTPAATIRGMASGVSPLLDATFMGVGIEPSNLLSFTGIDQPNPLTNQLLGNIGTYMGAPPHIRVGGNSGDNMLYDPSNKSLGIEFNPNAKGQGNKGSQTDSWTYGPGYYAALDNFPKGTPVTFGLNLAYNNSDAVSRVVTQAQSLYSSIKNVEINSLEVGNEPDLYITNNYRDSSWSTSDYGNEWLARADAVYQQVLKPLKLRQDLFEAACTATTATKSGHAYRISNLMDTGVASANGQYLRGWNGHDYFYYVDVSNFKLTIDRVLNLPATTQQFTEWTSQAQQANQSGKPYFLREMGSVGPTGIKGISDTFANTLWTFNFFLFASTVGVGSVQIHMTDNSYGSPWQPNFQNDVGPHVRSSYYAFAAIAQMLGTGCNTNFASLNLNNVPSSYSSRLAAYGVYRNNNLQSIAFINSNPTGSNTSVAPPQRRSHSSSVLHLTPSLHRRQSTPTVSFNVSLPNMAGKTFYLSTLSNDLATSTTNTTWNGMEYESKGDGSPTKINSTNAAAKQQVVKVGSDGMLTVTVADSSAVVANLGVVLGGHDGSKSLCVGNSSTSSTNSPASSQGAGSFTGTVSSDNHGLSKTAIIAIAAGGGGGAAVLAAVLFAVVLARLRKRRRAKELDSAVAGAKMGRMDSVKYKAAATTLGVPGGGGGTGGDGLASPSQEHLMGGGPSSGSGSGSGSGYGNGYGNGYGYAMSDRPGAGRRGGASAGAAAAAAGYEYAVAHSKTMSGGTLSSMEKDALAMDHSSSSRRYASGRPYQHQRTHSADTFDSPRLHREYADQQPYAYDEAAWAHLRPSRSGYGSAQGSGYTDGYGFEYGSGQGYDSYNSTQGYGSSQNRYDAAAQGTAAYGSNQGGRGYDVRADPAYSSYNQPPQSARDRAAAAATATATAPATATIRRGAPQAAIGASQQSYLPSTDAQGGRTLLAPGQGRLADGGAGAGAIGAAMLGSGAALSHDSKESAGSRPRRGRARQVDLADVRPDMQAPHWAAAPPHEEDEYGHEDNELVAGRLRPRSLSQGAAVRDPSSSRRDASRDALREAREAAISPHPTSSSAAAAAAAGGARSGGRQDERDAVMVAVQHAAARTDRPRAQSASRSGPARQSTHAAQAERSERQAYADWYAQHYGHQAQAQPQVQAQAQAQAQPRDQPDSSDPASGAAYGSYPNQEAYNDAYHQYYAQYYQAQARAAGAQGRNQATQAQTQAQAEAQAPAQVAYDRNPYRYGDEHQQPSPSYAPRNPRDAVRQARAGAQRGAGPGPGR